LSRKFYRMESETILHFLRQVIANNNRPWFMEHREEYLHAKALFEQMSEKLIARISLFDPSIAHLNPSDCVYRFYRDIRFSDDKSPYKNHMGCYIAAHGRKAYHGGYYIHLEPDNCMIAGGAWCLTPQMLRAVRQDILNGIQTYKGIVDAAEFKSYFPFIGMDRIKTVPKGFDKDNPYIDYIRPKDYSCACNVPDTFFAQPDWLDRTEHVCRVLKPFLDFVNNTIDDYE
jgi:uncharacterized protein (TIGR02453 family)